MNFCRLSVAWMLAGTTVVTGFIAAHGQQQSPAGGRKIEFSDPGGTGVASNLNSILRENTSLQNQEENLRKSFESFNAGGSLQGIGAPAMQRTPPNANSKRLKELLEKRQDWLFLSPEDHQSQPTMEEILGIPEYGPNGEARENKSPMERYFERMERANNPATNRTRSDVLSNMGFGQGKKSDGRGTDLNLTGAENEPGDSSGMDDPLKQLLRGSVGNRLFPDKTKPAGFADVFSQARPWSAESPEALRAQAARADEFKRIWDSQMPSLPSSSPVSGIAPFDPLQMPTSRSTSPVFALPKSPEPLPATTVTPVRDSLSPFPSGVGTVARPFELPAVSTSLPGLAAPASPLPEPTRTTVPSPDFNIPKRRF